jgi:tRNA-specific 2-thiouridylase
VSVDVPSATATVGRKAELLTERVRVDDLTWVAGPVAAPLLAQTSAHGQARPCRVEDAEVVFATPARRVAPGQAVVLYDGDEVVAGGTAA